MLKTLIKRHIPLAFMSSRERTEQIIRSVYHVNGTDIERLFRSCRVDANAQKEIFDLIHEQYGERLVSAYVMRDPVLSRKVMGEALARLVLRCE
jgi:hypothetical protein